MLVRYRCSYDHQPRLPLPLMGLDDPGVWPSEKEGDNWHTVFTLPPVYAVWAPRRTGHGSASRGIMLPQDVCQGLGRACLNQCQGIGRIAD
jgi:hypothetical protein